MTTDELDQLAAKLLHAYQQRGECAILVRTNGNGDVRAIYPQIDPALISAMLSHASDVVFDGPTGGAVVPALQY